MALLQRARQKMLHGADKQIRVGIARTDIDSILAKLQDRNITSPMPEQLAEKKLRKRYLRAKEKSGDTISFADPDCGLGSWPAKEAP